MEKEGVKRKQMEREQGNWGNRARKSKGRRSKEEEKGGGDDFKIPQC